MEMSGQLHHKAALPMGKEPVVPIGYEARWPQNWSGRCGEERNLCKKEQKCKTASCKIVNFTVW
jgi:hypothetical protein